MSILSFKPKISGEQTYRYVRAMERGEELPQTNAWLEQSPAHVRSFLLMAATPGLLADNEELKRVSVDEILVQIRAEKRRRQRLYGFGAAASVLLAVALGLMLFLGGQPQEPQWVIYSSGTSAREIALADGSKVELAPNTVVRVKLTAHRRTVAQDSGTARFRVAHLEPVVPFAVDSRDVSVLVQGTQFSVQIQEQQSTVHVFEGAVVVRGSDSRVPPQRLTPGQELTVRSNGSLVGDAEPGQLADAPEPTGEALRNTFNATPLSDVAFAFNQANKTPRFVVRGAAQSYPISATVRMDAPESLVQILNRQTDLSVRRKGNDIVVTMKDAH
jgi:transmembrane sensor